MGMGIAVRKMVRAGNSELESVVARVPPTRRAPITWRLVVDGSPARFRFPAFLGVGVSCEAVEEEATTAATTDVGLVPVFRFGPFPATAIRVVVKEATFFVP